MPQLHTYVNDELAERLKSKAQAQGMSTSQAIAQLITENYGGDWPANFRERFYGAWKGEAPIRPQQDTFPVRDTLE